MDNNRTIFFFEDDKEFAGEIKEFLESPPKRESDPALEVRHYSLAADAFRAINEWSGPTAPDLALLDLRQGNYADAGLDICRKIKETWDISVVFLSDYDSFETQITAHDLAGAQVYLSKAMMTEPHHRELLRSVVIANSGGSPRPCSGDVYESGSLKVDMDFDQASWKGEKIDLHDTDLGILDDLARRENRGKLRSYTQLLMAGGMRIPEDDLEQIKIKANVRARIKLIRKAITALDADFIYACKAKRHGIVNAQGRGYRWVPDK